MSAAGYSQAMLGVVDLMTGASADAAYEAAYGQYYSAFSQMHNAASQKVAAEANIAAIEQDRINTDKVIAMQQDQAEAQALVAAAVSGTEGQSVNDVLYQTEVNSSVASSNNRANAEQQVENQLAQIYQSQTILSGAGNVSVNSPSIGLSAATSAASFMISSGPEMMEGIDSLFGTTTGGIVNPAASTTPQLS